MKLLAIADWLAPYRIDLLNVLSKYCDVTVVYVNTYSPERNPKWESTFGQTCTFNRLKVLKLPKLMLPLDLNHYFQSGDYDIVFVDGYGSICQLWAIMKLRRKGIPYFVNVDGAIIRRENKLAAEVKKWILKGDCYYLCGSEVSNKYLMHYGVNANRIFNHKFTSLFEEDILKELPKEEERRRLREELGMQERHIILSVGRFSYMRGYGKGYDAIIRAAARMGSEYGFYIVGDEPTEEFIAMKAHMGAENVHFIGFKKKDELTQYYQASEVFVLMTVYDVWGLVINEAMANGLPVITTDMCVAGLQLVENGENGYVVAVGDDKELEAKIHLSVDNESVRRQMAHESLRRISPYTIENIASDHLQVFESFLGKN